MIVFSGFSQEHSGGIVVPTGFKIAANAPIDDRFVVADSLSLYDLPNKYDGMFASTIDGEDRVLWIYNGVKDEWSRVGKPSEVNTLQEVLTKGNTTDQFIVSTGGNWLVIPDTLTSQHFAFYVYQPGTPEYDNYSKGGVFGLSFMQDGRIAWSNFLLGTDGYGSDNTPYGFHALENLTKENIGNANNLISRGNLAVGNQSMRFFERGTRNTAVGGYAGRNFKNGDGNTLVGYWAGSNANDTLIGNTIIGNYSLPAGTSSLKNNIIITSGAISDVNKIGFRVFEDGTSVVPKQTQATFDSDTTGKAIVTKEILENAIPTKTSDLTNDSGFITSSNLTAENTSFNGTISALEADNVQDAIDEVVTMISEAGGSQDLAQTLNNGATAYHEGDIIIASVDNSESPTRYGILGLSESDRNPGYEGAGAAIMSANVTEEVITGATVAAESEADISWARLEVSTYTNRTKLLMRTDMPITVIDGIHQAGIKYMADYSANFTDRSLVDKEYVDNAIPTKTSDLTNDGDGESPFITEAEADLKYVESSDLAEVAFSNSYNDLDDLPTIPDQVNLIEGSNITITGTYPNLTISASGTVGVNWDDIGGDQSDINISGFTNDAGYITEADLPPSELQDLSSVLEQGGVSLKDEQGEMSVIYYENDLNTSSSIITKLGSENSSSSIYSAFPRNDEVNLNASVSTNSSGDGSSAAIGVYYTGTSDFSRILITDTGMYIGDRAHEKGLVYEQDYSENGKEDDLWIPNWGAVKDYVDSTTGGGTVTSVGLSVPTGFSVSNSPITTSGNIEITYASGYQGYTTAEASKLSGIEAGAQVNVATNLAQGTRTSTTVPITSSTGSSATLQAATTSLAGVMSAADKAKLDGLSNQDLDSVLDLGNTSERPIVLSDGVGKTITYSGESIVYDYKGKSITVEFESDNNYTHTLPNKNGTYAMLDDIPSLSGYATEAYVANYKRPVNRVSTGDVLSISLPESRFIFTGTSTQTFKVLSPTSGLDGVKIDFYNPTDYNVAVEVYTVGDEIMDLTSNSIVTSVTIGPKSGGEFFCDYNNDLWYYNKK